MNPPLPCGIGLAWDRLGKGSLPPAPDTAVRYTTFTMPGLTGSLTQESSSPCRHCFRWEERNKKAPSWLNQAQAPGLGTRGADSFSELFRLAPEVCRISLFRIIFLKWKKILISWG